MARLYLFCDTCKHKDIHLIPDDVLKAFGNKRSIQIKKAEEWLRNQGVKCPEGHFYAVIDIG
jgi:hypothetical protein